MNPKTKLYILAASGRDALNCKRAIQGTMHLLGKGDLYEYQFILRPEHARGLCLKPERIRVTEQFPGSRHAEEILRALHIGMQVSS